MRGCLWCVVAMLVSGSAGAVPSGTFDWAGESFIYPGVRYAFVRIETPVPVEAHALQIDLDTPSLDFFTTPRDPEWVANDTETRRQRTRDFLAAARADGRSMALAINATGWSPWPAPPSAETLADIQGLAVSEGVLVSPGTGTPAFIYRTDGTADILPAPNGFDISDVDTAVGGFGFCLQGGVPVTSGPAREPRTSIGLSTDKRTAIMLVVDGRRSGSQGASIEELGQWMLYFGANDALNLDGGGSSTMAFVDSQTPGMDKARVVNVPVGSGIDYLETGQDFEDRFFVSTERANANSLGLELTFMRFIQEPQSTQAPNGSTITLSAAVADAQGSVTYQWFKDGAPIASGPELTLAGVTPEDSAVYTVQATDSATMVAITSPPAEVEVAQPVPASSAWGLALAAALLIAAAITARGRDELRLVR